MSKEIYLPPNLQPLAGNAQALNVTGKNVGECMTDLGKQFPPLREHLFNVRGQLKKGLSVFINGKGSQAARLDSLVNDGDRIYVINLLVGG
jgi:hypothetical protein